jgi:hypothetical protein
MERAALDRWGKGDPEGYLELMARDVTYFDPTSSDRTSVLLVLQLTEDYRAVERSRRSAAL